MMCLLHFFERFLRPWSNEFFHCLDEPIAHLLREKDMISLHFPVSRFPVSYLKEISNPFNRAFFSHVKVLKTGEKITVLQSNDISSSYIFHNFFVAHKACFFML